MLGAKPSHAAPGDVAYEGVGFLARRDGSAFAAGQGRFGQFNRSQYFQTSALAFFPEQKRLLHCFFGPLQASAGNRFADEGLLIGSELYFHASNVGVLLLCVNHATEHETPPTHNRSRGNSRTCGASLAGGISGA